MQTFFVNCTYLLAKAQEKKFDDVFLVKIANEGTTLIIFFSCVLNYILIFARC